MSKRTHAGIGIIGSGFMARTYAEVTAKYTTDARLIAVAGGTRAAGLAGDYHIDAEPSVQELVRRPDIDAVFITSPEQVHLEHTLLAAAAGKHVLTEKPMALNVAQCDRMIAACKEAGVKLMVVQSQRYRGIHTRARKLIDQGKIGSVRQIRHWAMMPIEWTAPVVRDRPWYADPDHGIYLSQCTHDFDMLRWMAGSEARKLFGQITSYGDHKLPNLSIMAQIEFENGAMGQLWVSLEMPGATFPDSSFHTQVAGSGGLLDFDGYSYLDHSAGGEWARVWEQPAFDPLNPMDPVRLESYTAQNQAFIECILRDQPPPVSGADGRAAVELCQACLESARLGQAIDLPLRAGDHWEA